MGYVNTLTVNLHRVTDREDVYFLWCPDIGDKNFWASSVNHDRSMHVFQYLHTTIYFKAVDVCNKEK